MLQLPSLYFLEQEPSLSVPLVATRTRRLVPPEFFETLQGRANAIQAKTGSDPPLCGLQEPRRMLIDEYLSVVESAYSTPHPQRTAHRQKGLTQLI